MNIRSVRPAAAVKLAAALLVTGGVLLPARAEAATIASFQWVNYYANTAQNPSTVPSGTLTLSLPDSITTNVFDTGNMGAAAARAAITGFSYTFSDGITVGLGNLGTGSILDNRWFTGSKDPADSPFGYPAAPLGTYLLSGFNIPLTASGGTGAIFEAAGATNNGLATLSLASNQLTPQAPTWSSNDSGYWRLNTLQTAQVPAPAALPLLLTGLLGFAVRRRRRA